MAFSLGFPGIYRISVSSPAVMADSVLRLGSMVDTMWRLVRPSAERHPPEFSKQARIWVVLFNQFLVTLYAPRAGRTARQRNVSMV